ncbi:MAG: hypothetical protein D0530_08085 [Methylococcales bacterium]|nr:MAG: hypothetical protein D0530_08085 [Methylococcales bacterium]
MSGGRTTLRNRARASTYEKVGPDNSLSTELLTELQHALDAIAQEASVRVVVIAGAGKAYCARTRFEADAR